MKRYPTSQMKRQAGKHTRGEEEEGEETKSGSKNTQETDRVWEDDSFK